MVKSRGGLYTHKQVVHENVLKVEKVWRDAGVDTSNKHHHPHHNEIVVLFENYYQEGVGIRNKIQWKLVVLSRETIAYCPVSYIYLYTLKSNHSHIF